MSVLLPLISSAALGYSSVRVIGNLMTINILDEYMSSVCKRIKTMKVGDTLTDEMYKDLKCTRNLK